MAKRVFVTISRAARMPVALWAGLLLLGWLLFAALAYSQNTALMSSSMDSALPWLFGPLQELIPAEWALSPLSEVGIRVFCSTMYWLIVSLMWLSFVLAVRSFERASIGFRFSPIVFILFTSLLFGMTTFLWRTLHSTDVYLYILQGKMQAVYGLNPMVYTPNAITGDPLLQFTPWVNSYSLYGPAWLGIAYLVSVVAETIGGIAAYVVGFKIVNMIVLAACTWLLWDIGARLGWTLRRRSAAAAFLAWFPLLIIELSGNVHNDSLVVLFLVLGIWLHLRGWWPLAVAALVGCGVVKLPAFLFLPAYVVLLVSTSAGLKQAAQRAGGGAGIAAAVAVLAHLPYADPELPHALLHNPTAGAFVNSLASMLREATVDVPNMLYGRPTPDDPEWGQTLEAVRWPMWFAPFAVWGALAAIFSLRVRDFEGLIRAWGLMLLTYFVIASVWFWPWYVSWLVPVLALSPAGKLRRAGLWLAFGASMHYGFFSVLPYETGRGLFYYLPLAIFGPLLIYAGWEGARALIRRMRAEARPRMITVGGSSRMLPHSGLQEADNQTVPPAA